MLAIKLFLGFAPWIAFWIISSVHTLLAVQIGIGVAAVLVLFMSVTGLHRGMILWAGVAFFTFALVAVVGLSNLWVIQHLGILASGTLFTASLVSMLVRQPFTMSYARQSVPQGLWQSPVFLRDCYVSTGIWTLVFFANTVTNFVKLVFPQANHWYFEGAEIGFLLLGIALTTIYVERSKRQRLTPKYFG